MASFSSASFSYGSFSTGGEAPAVVVDQSTPSGVRKRRVIFDFEDDGRELVFASLMKKLEEAPVPIPRPRALRIRDTGKNEFVPYSLPTKNRSVESKAMMGMVLEGFRKAENLRILRKRAEEQEDEEMMQFIQFMLTHD